MRRKTEERSQGWRWIALFSIVAAIFFNYLSDNFLPGEDLVVITERYHSLFTPAGYVFSIWGLIYFSCLIYAVVQLQAKRKEIIYDRLARPFTFVNILGMTWIICYRLDLIGLSTVIIFTMLAISLIMYVKARNVVLRNDHSKWLSVPFSLYAAWLLVATMANVSILLLSLGWSASVPVQLITAMGMIFLASVLGVFTGFRCGDFLFPLVISWACIGIFAEQGSVYHSLGVAALMGAAFPLIWIVTTVTKRVAHRHKVWSNKFSFGEGMRLKLNGQNKLLFGRL